MGERQQASSGAAILCERNKPALQSATNGASVPTPRARHQREYIFVLDRSGSMEGFRLEAMKRAMLLALRSLPAEEGILFNLVSFGSKCVPFWGEGSREYKEENLELALKFIDRMRPDFGGTEMLLTLRQVFDLRDLDRPTSIFVITDGDSWALKELFDHISLAVSQARSQAPLRLFTLGIGASCSQSMIEGIAKAGNGKASLVRDGMDFEAKLLRLMDYAEREESSIGKGVKLDWDELEFKMLKSKENKDAVIRVSLPLSRRTGYDYDADNATSSTGCCGIICGFFRSKAPSLTTISRTPTIVVSPTPSSISKFNPMRSLPGSPTSPEFPGTPRPANSLRRMFSSSSLTHASLIIPEKLPALLRYQHHIGSFHPSVLPFLNVSSSKASKVVPPSPGVTEEERDKVIATILAIGFLEENLSWEEEKWRRVRMKAVVFCEGVLGGRAKVDEAVRKGKLLL
ncbi:vWA-like protein [Meredithblackwellia eburnea MCA 4105]